MNKGKINNHTRNQKRMYRIHKQEELIEKQRYIIGDLQQRIDKATEYINGWLSFSHINCNEIKECQNILKILKGELE